MPRHLILPLGLALALAACSPRTPSADTAATTPEPPTLPVPAHAEVPPDDMLAAIPESFLGTWDTASDHCGQDRDLAIDIEPQRIVYHESAGRVQQVQRPDEATIIVDLAMEGEGEHWQARKRYALSADGNSLRDTELQPPLERVRCAAPEATKAGDDEGNQQDAGEAEASAGE